VEFRKLSLFSTRRIPPLLYEIHLTMRSFFRLFPSLSPVRRKSPSLPRPLLPFPQIQMNSDAPCVPDQKKDLFSAGAYVQLRRDNGFSDPPGFFSSGLPLFSRYGLFSFFLHFPCQLSLPPPLTGSSPSKRIPRPSSTRREKSQSYFFFSRPPSIRTCFLFCELQFYRVLCLMIETLVSLLSGQPDAP